MLTSQGLKFLAKSKSQLKLTEISDCQSLPCLSFSMTKRTILRVVYTATTLILSMALPIATQASPPPKATVLKSPQASAKKVAIPPTLQTSPLKEALCTKDWGQAIFLVEKQIADLPSNQKETKSQLSSYRAHLLGVEAGFIIPRPNEFESLGCPKPPEKKPTAKQDTPSKPAAASVAPTENKNPVPAIPK